MRGVIFSIEIEATMENTLILVIGSCFILVGVSTGVFSVIESFRPIEATGGLS